MKRALAAIVLIALGFPLTACDATENSARPGSPIPGASAAGGGDSPKTAIERACGVDPTLLRRVWRGQAPGHSPEVVFVPKYPNFLGGFTLPNHSGPWNYLQRVPLVLYGRDHIAAGGAIDDRPASLADVFPTAGELVGARLPDRRGSILTEAVRSDTEGAPDLLMVIVWDGVGRNVLDLWPDAWPTLAALEENGTSYRDAIVGSSPSITPATHTTLGTGVFPRVHEVVSTFYRDESGDMREAYHDGDPSSLRLSTFADEIDAAYGNRSRVGGLIWEEWMLGMIGHGAQIDGGDRDDVIVISDEGDAWTNESYFRLPRYVDGLANLERHADAVDRADGKADGEWLGNDVLGQESPARVGAATDLLLQVLERERYGADDDAPDLFFVNYKMADRVGHRYFIDSEEMAATVRAQDDALGRIKAYLDREVDDYVIAVTADHGHTPSPGSTGAWPISPKEMTADVEDHFDAEPGTLIQGSHTVGLFIQRETAHRLGVRPADVADFLNDYTIAENNLDPELPEGYEERGNERIFSAAFTQGQLPAIMRCARRG